MHFLDLITKIMFALPRAFRLLNIEDCASIWMFIQSVKCVDFVSTCMPKREITINLRLQSVNKHFWM